MHRLICLVLLAFPLLSCSGNAVIEPAELTTMTAVRIGELQSSSMIGQAIGTYRLVLVATPGYVDRHGAPSSPAELGSARCLINLNMSPRNRWPFMRGGTREVAEVAGGLQIDNGEALRAATLEGAGISYLPLDLVQDDIATGALIRLLPEWQTLTLPINLLYPTRRTPRRVSALMHLFTTELRQSHPL